MFGKKKVNQIDSIISAIKLLNEAMDIHSQGTQEIGLDMVKAIQEQGKALDLILEDLHFIKRHLRIKANKDHQILEKFEDHALGKMAEKAQQDGDFLSTDESASFMNEWESEIEAHKKK